MVHQKASSKERILAAAAQVAREAGAAKLSLDAVAARAGVSKGGLLYHFPSKAALMRALVEDFIAQFEAELNLAGESAPGETLLASYIKLSAREWEQTQPGAAGVLAALAEDPDFLKPVAAFKRRLLDRLKVGSTDVDSLLIIYLALEGMRSMKLLETDILTPEERSGAIAAMLRRSDQSPST